MGNHIQDVETSKSPNINGDFHFHVREAGGDPDVSVGLCLDVQYLCKGSLGTDVDDFLWWVGQQGPQQSPTSVGISLVFIAI